MKKRKYHPFWRSFYVTSVIIFCLIIGITGAASAYENTLKIGFGQEKSAFQITENGIRIFDFTLFKSDKDVMKI
ncbi:MAG: hypothetical protein E7562_07500 [Ruminococcaceae bacterium]|nr:hypothetical protein [Oscillospiraceae bacterium]